MLVQALTNPVEIVVGRSSITNFTWDRLAGRKPRAVSAVCVVTYLS